MEEAQGLSGGVARVACFASGQLVDRGLRAPTEDRDLRLAVARALD
jgi:hypothetical protein